MVTSGNPRTTTDGPGPVSAPSEADPWNTSSPAESYSRATSDPPRIDAPVVVSNPTADVAYPAPVMDALCASAAKVSSPAESYRAAVSNPPKTARPVVVP